MRVCQFRHSGVVRREAKEYHIPSGAVYHPPRDAHATRESCAGSDAAELALALASAVAVVLAAGAAELALRVARPAFLRHSRAEHPHVYSETYGWALRPHARYVGRGGETITVNAHGYRGGLHSEAPAPGATRVVMLGDSITFGTGVGDDQTFSHLLDASPRLEVLNLGVDGYGTDQALIRLEREGLPARPHVVILNFCVRNDYFDNALPGRALRRALPQAVLHALRRQR